MNQADAGAAAAPPVPGQNQHDVVIIGGGQSALATAWFLRRTGLDFILLDAEDGPGGAWRHAWDSLRLFSPSEWSSIAGWQMPVRAGYPTRQDVVDYLTRYEDRYRLPVVRPCTVEAVVAAPGGFSLHTSRGAVSARAVVSATGTWRNPHVPEIEGAHGFKGRQLHSAHYTNPAGFAGQRVLVVGGGNSGAQVLAEVSTVAHTTWVTQQPPVFLADDVDGRVLFARATERWRAHQQGRTIDQPVGGLGDIVMVEPVREARGRGALGSVRPFVRFTEHGVEWPDGSSERVDAIIWCTGFRPALEHLRPLQLVEDDGRVAVQGTRSLRQPGLWLVGYGDWTGPASATLVGVTRAARSTVEEIAGMLADTGHRAGAPDPDAAATADPGLPQ